MAAAATDLLQEVGLATATTLDANYTINDVTLTVVSTSGMPTATGITVAIDVIDSNGEQVPGTYNEYVGVVASATSLSSVDWVGGSGDRNYSAGATTRVYIPVSAERENRIVEHGLAHADQDGTLKAGAVDVAAVLADNVVTTAKILDDNVTAPKIVGIDKSNLTTDSNPYKFRVYRNAAANTGNGAFAQIVFDSEHFDTNNNFATGTYTAPVAGFYQFNYTVGMTINASDTYDTALYVNGNEYSRGFRDNVNTVEVSGTGADLVQLAANDTVDVRARAAGGARALVTGATRTHFSGFLVCRT